MGVKLRRDSTRPNVQFSISVGDSEPLVDIPLSGKTNVKIEALRWISRPELGARLSDSEGFLLSWENIYFLSDT